MPNRPELTGGDLREAMRMAAADMGEVQTDMRRLAKESQFNALEGDERKDFFRNLTQDEFNLLHDLAVSMGPSGLNATERLTMEAQDIYKEDS